MTKWITIVAVFIGVAWLSGCGRTSAVRETSDAPTDRPIVTDATPSPAAAREPSASSTTPEPFAKPAASQASAAESAQAIAAPVAVADRATPRPVMTVFPPSNPGSAEGVAPGMAGQASASESKRESMAMAALSPARSTVASENVAEVTEHSPADAAAAESSQREVATLAPSAPNSAEATPTDAASTAESKPAAEGVDLSQSCLLDQQNVMLDKGDDYWRKILSREQFRVTRMKATEKPFTGKYLKNKQDGTYCCICCGTSLFSSETKFESGTGWPSFYDAVDKGSIKLVPDHSWGMERMEVVCAHCGAHLGHVFNDGPKPTGLRYCINSISLDFQKKPNADAAAQGAKKTPTGNPPPAVPASTDTGENATKTAVGASGAAKP